MFGSQSSCDVTLLTPPWSDVHRDEVSYTASDTRDDLPPFPRTTGCGGRGVSITYSHICESFIVASLEMSKPRAAPFIPRWYLLKEVLMFVANPLDASCSGRKRFGTILARSVVQLWLGYYNRDTVK